MKVLVDPTIAELPSNFTLAQATSAIRFEEKLGYIFKDCEIKKKGKKEINVVNFDDFVGGPAPSNILLVDATQDPPQGFEQVDSTTMLLKPGRIQVRICRKA